VPRKTEVYVQERDLIPEGYSILLMRKIKELKKG
jgi:hypothetical protein